MISERPVMQHPFGSVARVQFHSNFSRSIHHWLTMCNRRAMSLQRARVTRSNKASAINGTSSGQ
jgi:hypothetical protein